MGISWGKIEAGETPEECLMRECHEELGVTIETEQIIREVEYEYPGINVKCRYHTDDRRHIQDKHYANYGHHR